MLGNTAVPHISIVKVKNVAATVFHGDELALLFRERALVQVPAVEGGSLQDFPQLRDARPRDAIFDSGRPLNQKISGVCCCSVQRNGVSQASAPEHVRNAPLDFKLTGFLVLERATTLRKGFSKPKIFSACGFVRAVFPRIAKVLTIELEQPLPLCPICVIVRPCDFKDRFRSQSWMLLIKAGGHPS